MSKRRGNWVQPFNAAEMLGKCSAQRLMTALQQANHDGGTFAVNRRHNDNYPHSLDPDNLDRR